MPEHSTLHFFYRSTGGDNPKGRPSFYSKLNCLRSFLKAQAAVAGRSIVTFVNDGPIPDDRRLLMVRHGTVVDLDGIGNTPCHLETLRLACSSDRDLVYLCEDDYLHTDGAFSSLLGAFEELGDADYVTLYDHPDRYTRRDDADGGLARVYVAGGWHWRSVESTCMTFGARRGKLQADAWIHRIPTRKPFPADRRIWRMTQGIGPHRWRFPKRRLIGAIPGLATHMDPDRLSPNVDWEEVALAANQWSAE